MGALADSEGLRRFGGVQDPPPHCPSDVSIEVPDLAPAVTSCEAKMVVDVGLHIVSEEPVKRIEHREWMVVPHACAERPDRGRLEGGETHGPDNPLDHTARRVPHETRPIIK